MNVKKIFLTAGLAAVIMLSGCGETKELKEKVEPIADAMCKFINIQNQLQEAVMQNDSMRTDSLTALREQLRIEMTVLNEEFQAKFAEKSKDEKFLKEYKKLMNEALLACPHLSKTDREMMEKQMEE